MEKALTKIQAIATIAILIAAGAIGVIWYYMYRPGPAGPEKEYILLGFTQSITGQYAPEGKQYMTGYLYWVSKVNEYGGLYVREYGRKLPVKVVYYDDMSDPTKAVLNYEKLITIDGVDLLLGPYGSVMGKAVAPVMEKYKFPWVSSGTADTLYQQGWKYFFGVYKASQAYTGPLIPYLADLCNSTTIPENQKPRRIAIIYGNDDLGLTTRQGAKDLIKSKAEVYGNWCTVVYERQVPLGWTEFTTPLLEAQSAGADVLILCLRITEASAALRQMETLKIYFKAVHAIIGPTMPEWKDLGPTGWYTFSYTGMYTRLNASGVIHKSQIPWNSMKMAKEWKDLYGFDMDMRGLLGICMTMELFEAVENAGTLDREKIREALFKTSPITPRGRFVYMPDGSIDPTYFYFFLVQTLPPDGSPYVVYPKAYPGLENYTPEKEPVYPRPPWGY